MPALPKFTNPMPPVMSHAEWMERTHVTMKIRGTRLKELDTAIYNFEKAKTEEALAKVAEALLAWMEQSHPNGNFLDSERNHDQAIGALLPVINWFFSDPCRREMLKAVEHLKELYRQQEMKQYTGQKLEFKLKSTHAVAQVVILAAEKFIEFVRRIAPSIGLKDDEAQKLARHDDFRRRFQNVFNIIYMCYDKSANATGQSHGSGKLDFLEFIPGVSFVKAYKSLVEAVLARRRALKAKILFESESPEILFCNLAEYFEREIETAAVRAASESLNVVAKVTPGLQPLVIAGYLARLAESIACFVRDYREKEEANAILTSGKPIEPTILAAAPVLAAYHICALDTAGTALFLFDERRHWISYDFVEKVEQYNRGVLVPIRAKARQLVAKSDLVLTPNGLPLISLKDNPAKIAEQRGWFWWKYQSLRRKLSGPSEIGKNAIEGPRQDAA
jgi:hypothetical protein